MTMKNVLMLKNIEKSSLIILFIHLIMKYSFNEYKCLQ